jgi:hypothetical protein
MFRNGVLSGEACIREVIAYIVDQELHFYAVPKTTFVQAKHPSFSYCTKFYIHFFEIGKVVKQILELRFPFLDIMKIFRN